MMPCDDLRWDRKGWHRKGRDGMGWDERVGDNFIVSPLRSQVVTTITYFTDSPSY